MKTLLTGRGLPEGKRAFGLILAGCCLLGLSVAGCDDKAGTATAEDEKEIRSALKSNEPFDINKVPAEHRDKVRGMMQKPPSAGNAANAGAPGGR